MNQHVEIKRQTYSREYYEIGVRVSLMKRHLEDTELAAVRLREFGPMGAPSVGYFERISSSLRAEIQSLERRKAKEAAHGD